MGGKAFAHLNIPRISHGAYTILSAQIVEALQLFFVHVSCPAESPGKEDHGDVDVLVEEWRGAVDVAEVVRALGATEWIGHLELGATTNLAIPVLEAGDVTVYHQVDILVCRPDMLEWVSFIKSYGDLWNILGSMIRQFGLTTNDKGFFVRIPEIEIIDKKKGMILLTKDPARVLPFLGLDNSDFERGWQSQTEMFNWARRCRFFRKDVFRDEGANLKANDRKRLKLRPVYRSWVAEYLPTLPESESSLNTTLTRELVLEEALVEFDVRNEFNDRVAGWRAIQQANRTWKKISHAIPLPHGAQYGKVLRALKRRISLLPGTEPEVHDQLRPPPFWDANNQIDDYLLCTWVNINWEAVKESERRRVAQIDMDRLAKGVQEW